MQNYPNTKKLLQLSLTLFIEVLDFFVDEYATKSGAVNTLLSISGRTSNLKNSISDDMVTSEYARVETNSLRKTLTEFWEEDMSSKCYPLIEQFIVDNALIAEAEKQIEGSSFKTKTIEKKTVIKLLDGSVLVVDVGTQFTAFKLGDEFYCENNRIKLNDGNDIIFLNTVFVPFHSICYTFKV